MDLLSYLLLAALGAVLASFLALIPALHVYNVITLAFLFAGGWQAWLHPDPFAMLLLGMVTGYAVLSVIPSIYLAAPDGRLTSIFKGFGNRNLTFTGYQSIALNVTTGSKSDTSDIGPYGISRHDIVSFNDNPGYGYSLVRFGGGGISHVSHQPT